MPRTHQQAEDQPEEEESGEGIEPDFVTPRERQGEEGSGEPEANPDAVVPEAPVVPEGEEESE